MDPVSIAVATTTTTKKGGETAAATTTTKGVSALKNAEGGLDILLSPGVKDKLKAIANGVVPCPAAKRHHRRQPHNKSSNNKR